MKVTLSLAKGKKAHDKRETIKNARNRPRDAGGGQGAPEQLAMAMTVRTKVPLLDLRPRYRPIRQEILDALTRVCDSQRFIQGPEVEGLERELAGTLEVADAVGVSSGTDALLVAMMALGVGAGDEVITSTYSFFATAGCIARLGAIPRLVDIDPVTYNLSPSCRPGRGVAAYQSDRPRASLRTLRGHGSAAGHCRRNGCPDRRGCLPGDRRDLQGAPAGAMGRVGCFSFFPSKNLGAFGDGGLVTTQDVALGREIRRLRNHGSETKYYHEKIGGNFRLDALQAAVLARQAAAPAGVDSNAPRECRQVS